MARKTTFTSVCGKQYVCHDMRQVAKFILFAVSTGKVQLRGKPPRLKKSNPKVKALMKLKAKHFKDKK